MVVFRVFWLFFVIGCYGQDQAITHFDSDIRIALLPNEIHQSIQGFGASDAWSIQFIGKYWPLSKRHQIADLLFSTETKTNLDPKGIGLSQWRFNIGAGSEAQGDESGIKDSWRRTSCFLTDGGYNWTAQDGQFWFANAAKERGVTQFIAFSNSPPVTMTKNNKAYSNEGREANLAPSKYQMFTNFLTQVLVYAREKKGIHFNYIAPFNEPQWDWKQDSGQEGSPWTNSQISEITRLLDARIQSKHITTKIELAESGQLNYLYEIGDKKERAHHIDAFFNRQSSNYIGDLETLASKISAHSYYTTYPSAKRSALRKTLKSQLDNLSYPLEFWMTEYCVLENNPEIVGRGRDLGMAVALYVAQVIHDDLTLANASAWQWWLAVSPYNYKDGLIYIDKNTQDGVFYTSKLLWTLGHYSRFIRPGFTRIGVKTLNRRHGDIDKVLMSAYKGATAKDYVAVFTNLSDLPQTIQYQVDTTKAYQAKIYQTSDTTRDNLSFKGVLSQNQPYIMPSKSIVTLMIK